MTLLREKSIDWETIFTNPASNNDLDLEYVKLSRLKWENTIQLGNAQRLD